jgi:hypothetical protein
MVNELDPLSLIRKAKAEMEASRLKEKADRERRDAELDREEARLAIAEQVYAELVAKAAESLQQPAAPPPVAPPPATPSASGTTPTTKSEPSVTKKIPAAGGTPRPPNIPTVPDMVTLLLEHAEKNGRAGLTSTELMAAIDSVWWPGVSVNLIMPTVYRCISKGHRFKKQGNIFIRKREEVIHAKRVTDELKLVS